jgi:hypothetical protein
MPAQCSVSPSSPLPSLRVDQGVQVFKAARNASLIVTWASTWSLGWTSHRQAIVVLLGNHSGGQTPTLSRYDLCRPQDLLSGLMAIEEMNLMSKEGVQRRPFSAFQSLTEESSRRHQHPTIFCKGDGLCVARVSSRLNICRPHHYVPYHNRAVPTTA